MRHPTQVLLACLLLAGALQATPAAEPGQALRELGARAASAASPAHQAPVQWSPPLALAHPRMPGRLCDIAGDPRSCLRFAPLPRLCLLSLNAPRCTVFGRFYRLE